MGGTQRCPFAETTMVRQSLTIVHSLSINNAHSSFYNTLHKYCSCPYRILQFNSRIHNAYSKYYCVLRTHLSLTLTYTKVYLYSPKMSSTQQSSTNNATDSTPPYIINADHLAQEAEGLQDEGYFSDEEPYINENLHDEILERDYSELEQAYDALENSYLKLEQDLNDLQTERSNLQTSLQAVVPEYTALQDNFLGLQNTLENLRGSYAGLESNFFGLDTNRTELLNASSQLQYAYDEKCAYAQDLESRLRKLRREHKCAISRIVDQEERIAELRAAQGWSSVQLVGCVLIAMLFVLLAGLVYVAVHGNMVMVIVAWVAILDFAVAMVCRVLGILTTTSGVAAL
jgi:predicted  nucleic acid-binding Zn-ribbon protein